MTDAVQIEMIRAIPGTLTAAGVIVVGVLTYRNGRKTDSVHDSLNSRLDEWKSETAAKLLAAYAQGKQDERDAK
jgi:hypothetical protein